MAASLFRRLRARLKYRNYARDLDRELALHREMTEREAAGKYGHDPAHAAALRLGNTTLVREEVRAMWIPRFWQQLSQDGRYAVRGFRRTPGFTLAAVFMLALGITVATGSVVVLNGLFLRGWPVPQSGDVFRASPILPPSAGRLDDGLSLGAYRHVATNAQQADYVAYTTNFGRVGTTKDERRPGTVPIGAFVSDNFFAALRVPLAMGTAPHIDPASPPSIVISYRTWQTVFAADPSVIGRAVWVDGNPAHVAGVTAERFGGLDREVMFYAPLTGAPSLTRRGRTASITQDETQCCVAVAGRIRRGTGREAIRAELEGLVAQYRSAIGRPVLTIALLDTSGGAGLLQRGNLGAMLAIAGAATLALLVLTCANVGNLFLARSLRRQREITTRLALGAGRGRLIRQLLTEGLVLASLAGSLALAVAAALPRVAASAFPPGAIDVDAFVVAATLGLIFLVALTVSLAPALRTTRVLWSGSAAMATAPTSGLRAMLLGAQIAVATALIASAALLVRGIQFGLTSPSDFALQTTTVASLDWAEGAKPGPGMAPFVAALTRLSEMSAVPFGVVSNAPASQRSSILTSVRLPGRNEDFSTRLYPMSASAGAALDLRLTRGRWPADRPNVHEATVNERLSHLVWSGADPIGQPLQLDFNKRSYTVVGVVADSHVLSPSAVEPTLHVSILEDSSSTPFIVTEKTRTAEAAVTAAIRSVDPSARVSFTPLTESLRATMSDARVGVTIAGGLAFTALLLAMIGVYGVCSYLVEERRREIGIRLALGADRARIRLAVFRATRAGLLGGGGSGLLLAALAGLGLERFLFGLSPFGPVSYLIVSVILVVTALIATAVPIRRAVGVNPAITLRAD